MISDIRKTLQSRGAKLVIWATLGAVCAGTILTMIQFSRRFADDYVAKVNGNEIGVNEFRRKYLETQNMVKEIRQMYGPQADMVLSMYGFDRKPDQLVLDSIVGEKVMKVATDALGISVHHGYAQTKLIDPFFVRQYLSGVVPPQALREGTLDVAALNYHLEQQGVSPAEFDELLNQALLRAFLFRLIEGGLYLPEDALKSAYSGQFLKKKFAYATLPLSRYVTKAREQKITPTQREEYFAQSKSQEKYRTPEKRSAKVWTFIPDSFGVVVSEDELKKEYNRRRTTYVKKPAEVLVQHILFTFTDANKLAVRGQAQEVLKEVQAKPESFAEAAVKHSQSKDKGTTLTLKRADKTKEFTQTAFDLKQGAISGVIETPEGFEIIKLLEKKAPVYKALDDVKAELTTSLKRDKFARAFNANAQRVVSQSREEPSFLTNFIERHKGQLSSVSNVVRTDSQQSEKIFAVRRVADRAFYQEGDKGYILEVTQIVPAAIPSLSSLEQTVDKDLYEERALELLKADLKKSLKEIRSGEKTLAQVAQALNVTVEITDWVSFDDQASLKKLKDLKVNLPALMQLAKQGDAETGLTDTLGYIIQVKQIDPLVTEEFEKKKPLLRYRLGREELQGLSASFIQTLRDTATIEINAAMMRQAAR